MKTKETSKKHYAVINCNRCGKEKSGSIEGICEHCGKFGMNIREQALAWWRGIRAKTVRESWDLMDKYFPNQKENGGMALLNGDQIEEIWRKETQEYNPFPESFDKALGQERKNQKQFKQFDKELFKKYIEKFGNEDKYKAMTVLFNSLPEDYQKTFLNVN